MRYRLMASYLGASYQAAVGPSDHDVTLFAAPPPPEEHGFSPAPGGIWRKQVRLNDLDGLWESRPIGSYHGEPCLVLDDLGDRLHIVYLGMDSKRAAQLGYWEVDRGVFEVVVPRHDVTDLAEERHEFPIALLLSALPRALAAGDPGSAGRGFDQHVTGAAPDGAVSGGMTGWNGQTAAPQPARGQLPAGGLAQLPRAPLPQAQHQQAQSQQAQSQQAQSQQAQSQQAQPPSGQPPARPQQPAAAGQQFPSARPYQLPAGPERGAGLPGAPGPATAASALGQPGVSPRGETAPGSAPHLSGGQPALGGQQYPGMAAGPGAPYSAAVQPGVPGAQPAAMNQAQPPAGPPLPGRPQLPMAQPALGAQHSLGAQPSLGAQQSPGVQQPFAQQFPQPAPLGTPQAPDVGQGTGPQQAPTAQSALPAQPTPTQPSLTQPAPTQPSLTQSAQPVTPSAQQAPAAVAAWHGSPAPDGSGTWYFQPGPDPQGTAASGYPVNGMPQAGYAQPGQGTAVAAPSGGPAGTQQYAQPAPQTPVPAYQQAPVAAGQPQAGQPAQLAAASPAAQHAPAAPAPQFLPQPSPSTQQAPLSAQAAGPASLAEPKAQAPAMTSVPPTLPPVAAAGAPPGPAATPLAPPPTPAPSAAPVSAAAAADVIRTGPLAPAPPPAPGQQSPGGLAAGALGKLTGAVRGRRAARKPRLAMSAIFADLVDMADIPRSAYAVDEEVTGAMCLFKTDGGYEVFSCAEDARHEVRFFEEEESAYFYLFGVLAAEALRNGRLSPRRG